MNYDDSWEKKTCVTHPPWHHIGLGGGSGDPDSWFAKEISMILSEAFTSLFLFLQTPLPCSASSCYHSPGPRVALCGSWPCLPLAHVCVTLSVERPDTISCPLGKGGGGGRIGCSALSGTGKGSGHRPGLGERVEGTEHNIYPWSHSNV